MKENTREISIFKERILQYSNKQGISKYEIYQNTGISNGVFSQKGGLSEDNLLKFLSHYTDISLEWLFTGKGPMLRDEKNNKSGCPEEENTGLIRELIDKNGELQQQIGKLMHENGMLCEQIKNLEEKEQNKSPRNTIHSGSNIAVESE